MRQSQSGELSLARTRWPELSGTAIEVKAMSFRQPHLRNVGFRLLSFVYPGQGLGTSALPHLPRVVDGEQKPPGKSPHRHDCPLKQPMPGSIARAKGSPNTNMTVLSNNPCQAPSPGPREVPTPTWCSLKQPMPGSFARAKSVLTDPGCCQERWLCKVGLLSCPALMIYVPWPRQRDWPSLSLLTYKNRD